MPTTTEPTRHQDANPREERLRLLAGEALAGRELARLARRAPWLLRAPRGHGEPVLLLPGLGASDLSNAAVRGYLRAMGYDAHGWGLGRNRGDVRAAIPRVSRLVASLHERTGERVHLIGWSLGGVVARGVARRDPHLIAQIITYGSPILDRSRVPVPITAIHSRADGIVPWQACIDDFSPDVENVAVTSAHLGMGIDPDVWSVVIDRLARHRAGSSATDA
jgi:alpha-beta hydrolase superfamily lysophospholipase